MAGTMPPGKARQRRVKGAFRRPVLLALCASIGACSPDGQPPSPELAGWWRPEHTARSCTRSAIRFDRTGVQVRQDGRLIKVLDFVAVTVGTGFVRVQMRATDESAIRTALFDGNAWLAAEFVNRTISLALTRSGERLVPVDPLIHQDGVPGLRAPRAGEGRLITRIFTMNPCEE